MARRRSRVSGVNRLRRKLRRFPEEATQEIRTEVETATGEGLFETQRRTPVDDGDLVRALHKRLGRDGLTGEFGWTKRQKRKWKLAGWRAHFTEYGTLGGRIRTGPRKGQQVPQQRGQGMLTKAAKIVLPRFQTNARAAINRAISRIALGSNRTRTLSIGSDNG